LHTSDHKPADFTLQLADEAATIALGKALAQGLAAGMVVYLTGDLGAGKTTLARGVLRGLGYAGKVKSPTFALVEVYEFSRLYLYHFDFYRFDRPQELADAGFREHFHPASLCLVEWPEKAAGLPPADITIAMQIAGEGRRVTIRADTEAGRRCTQQLKNWRPTPPL
jgi:tRNA threonylcarbamoyladenosine biosynthesis protein TsaE